MEYKVLRQVGLRSILRGDLWRKSAWRDVLPVQTPQQIQIDELSFASIDELLGLLDSQGLPHSDGGNAVYLHPAAINGTAFRVIRDHYPEDTGLKIVRDPGSVASSQYVTGDGRSSINKKLTASHGHMTLSANLLHHNQLGPRLYDLVELVCAGQVWTAYAVQHVDGRMPTMEECQSGIQRLQALESSGVTRMTLPGGYEHKDFACPECNNNALTTADGSFHYVDFQNFVLADYERYLVDLAKAASNDTRFGPNDLLWGGRYFYQSIPAVRMPSRRKIDQRLSVIDEMLASNDVELKGKVVLDIGCNFGMAISQYLKHGAKWCHGWDMPETLKHTGKLLPAIGCTRFSLTGGELQKEQELENDVPEFVRRSLEGCVISYLSERMRVGWLDSLSSIHWSHLIYEEHQGDDFESDMNDFAKLVDFDILEARKYSDGLSDDRTIAILKRKY